MDLGTGLGAGRLGDGLHAALGGLVHPVPEGKKGVRAQRASLQRKDGALRRDARGIHPAHLPGPDAHRPASVGKDNGVALDVARDRPGDAEGPPLLLGGRARGHHPPVELLGGHPVGLLDQHPARHRAEVEARSFSSGERGQLGSVRAGRQR